ncbi:hypothetical protein BH11PSE8_BH11PSE8_16310 [soil metagenome]
MSLFDTTTHRVDAARRDDIPSIQAFFDANPAYTRMVEGRPVSPNAAAVEFDEMPPPGMAYGERWFLTVRDRRSGAIDAVLDVVKDLLAPGIWHIGLFFVAERLHGQGLAARLHAALEQWAEAQGARWLRLGVVEQNQRGARFWRRQGYGFVCSREAAAAGGRVNNVFCLVKPLGDNTREAYLAAQGRDALQPEPSAWAALNAR